MFYKVPKNRHFPKGIVHVFCPKIEFLFIWVFWYTQVRKGCFFDILDRKERILDWKINVLKRARRKIFS